jgi:hypothetical protein
MRPLPSFPSRGFQNGGWQHPPYFHDGSSPTFADVVDRYNTAFHLNLTAQRKSDLVQYLLSL